MTDRDSFISETVEYRLLPESPGYCVGNDGSVWSRQKRRGLGIGKGTTSSPTGEWIKLRASLQAGYPSVTIRLSPRSPRAKYTIHRLVMMAFVGPCPVDMEVAHENGDPLDNRLENLSYKTPAQNQADRVRHGTDSRGMKNSRAKINDNVVNSMRADYATGQYSKCAKDTQWSLVATFGGRDRNQEASM